MPSLIPNTTGSVFIGDYPGGFIGGTAWGSAVFAFDGVYSKNAGTLNSNIASSVALSGTGYAPRGFGKDLITPTVITQVKMYTCNNSGFDFQQTGQTFQAIFVYGSNSAFGPVVGSALLGATPFLGNQGLGAPSQQIITIPSLDTVNAYRFITIYTVDYFGSAAPFQQMNLAQCELYTT